MKNQWWVNGRKAAFLFVLIIVVAAASTTFARASEVCIAAQSQGTTEDPCSGKLARSSYRCVNERMQTAHTFELDVPIEPSARLIKVTYAGQGFVLKQKAKKGDATALNSFGGGAFFRRVQVTTPELNDATGQPAKSICFLPISEGEAVLNVRVPTHPRDLNSAYYSVKSAHGIQVRSLELQNVSESAVPLVRAFQAASDTAPTLVVQNPGLRERLVVDGLRSFFLVPQRYASYTPFTLIMVDRDGNLIASSAQGRQTAPFGQIASIAFNMSSLQSSTDILALFSQLDGRTYRLYASGIVDLVRNDGTSAQPTDVAYVNPGKADYSLIRPAVSLKGFARGILKLAQTFEENPSFDWE